MTKIKYKFYITYEFLSILENSVIFSFHTSNSAHFYISQCTYFLVHE